MSINTLSTTEKRWKFEKVKEGLNWRVRKQKRSPHKRKKEMKTNAPKSFITRGQTEHWSTCKLFNARLSPLMIRIPQEYIYYSTSSY
jgi:hypothetical protein